MPHLNDSRFFCFNQNFNDAHLLLIKSTPIIFSVAADFRPSFLHTPYYDPLCLKLQPVSWYISGRGTRCIHITHTTFLWTEPGNLVTAINIHVTFANCVRNACSTKSFYPHSINFHKTGL